jgi:hypothetical protein
VIGAFDTVYKAVQGMLSADFWASVFVPVALFAFIHAAILTQFGWHPDLAVLLDDTGKSAKWLLIVVALLVLAGYLLQAFLPLLRGMLEGTLLPEWLHDALRAGRIPAAREKRLRIKAAMDALFLWQDRYRELDAPDGAFRTAYAAAVQLPPGATDEDSVRRAEERLDRLRRALNESRLPDIEEVHAAETLLLAAFLRNNPEQGALSDRLYAANTLFVDLVTEAVNQAVYEVDIARARIRNEKALDVPRATLLGDARQLAELYTVGMYNVRFNDLWPRLLIAVQAEVKDDPGMAAVSAAQARVNFAVLSMLLTVSVPVVWLPLAALHAGRGWLILVIGGGAPLLLTLFYHVAVEGQMALSDLVKTMVDRHRLLVLKMFRQPTPVSLAEERLIWGRLHQAAEEARTAYEDALPTDITYVSAVKSGSA